MKIETIHIKNFRALYDVELRDIPALAVFVGANGSGKSTLFQVFGFLKDALQNNVTVALQKLGGYKEVATRGHESEPIVIEIKFFLPIPKKERLARYYLQISAGEKSPVVQCEVMDDHCHSFHFENGRGYVGGTAEETTAPWRILDSRDILALKGFGQFKKFEAASALRNLIENCHAFAFDHQAARRRVQVGVAEHLSESGDNLPVVAQNLYRNDRKTFDKILEKFQSRIPGMSKVSTIVTEDGHVLLRFHDGKFEDPFNARYVSDGTIKMFAYLVLLHDPNSHSLLCIEEPENQLHPNLLGLLVEELRDYAMRDGQVFISTHSPNILNAAEIEETFLLQKTDGIAGIYPLAESERVSMLIDGGKP